MKLGNLDGTPTEIRDLIENNGLRLKDYIKKPEAPRARHFVVPAILFLCVAIALLYGTRAGYPGLAAALALFALALATWLTVAIQVRFKNVTASVCVGVGALAVILLATGFPLTGIAELLRDAKHGK